MAFSHSRSLTAFGFKKSCELLCNLISCKMYSESYDSLNLIEDLQFKLDRSLSTSKIGFIKYSESESARSPQSTMETAWTHVLYSEGR